MGRSLEQRLLEDLASLLPLHKQVADAAKHQLSNKRLLVEQSCTPLHLQLSVCIMTDLAALQLPYIFH